MNDLQKFTNTDLIVPIYVDTLALYTLVATIEDGFTLIEKVTRQDEDATETHENKRSLSATFTMPFLKLGANPAKSQSDISSSGRILEGEKYHTAGSLLSRFRRFLIDEQLLPNITKTDQDWREISTSDFVEIQGTLNLNPMLDTLNTINSLLDLILNIPTSMTQNKDSRKTRGKDSTQSQLKPIKKMLEGFRTELTSTEAQFYVVNMAHPKELKAVITIFPHYMRDVSGQELVGRELRILGKVTQKFVTEEDGIINLLSGTSFGSLSEDIISQFIDAFQQMNDSGMNLPEVHTSISAPVLQILPVAVYV